jgi:hypothetical protein
MRSYYFIGSRLWVRPILDSRNPEPGNSLVFSPEAPVLHQFNSPLALSGKVWHNRPMPDKPPTDPADHAEDFSHRYAFPLDQYCAIRMQELGIPERLHGAPDFETDGKWRAFITQNRTGGRLTTGITVNSGCLNPELLRGKNGARIFAKARLRDRIDAIIAHEYEEDRLGTHEASLKHGAKTDLPVSDEARRILRAMGR